MSFTNRPSYQTQPVGAPVYNANPAIISRPSTLNQTYTLSNTGSFTTGQSLPSSTTYSTAPLSGYEQQGLSQGTILPQSNFQSAPLSSMSSLGSALPQSNFSQQGFQGQQLPGQQLPGQQLPGQQLPGQQAGQLPNPDLELKKRMLDKHRDLKMKEAEMETNKEKKLEEKAEKQREKAVKWVSRGVAPGMAHRHEVKADKLEHKAHEHHMKAEGYKLEAKQLETERKAYDPPKEEKKTPARPGQSGAKSAASKTTEVKKDASGDKKIETTTEKKVEPAKTETSSQPTAQLEKKNEQPIVQEKKVEQTQQHTAPQTGSSTA